MPLVTAQIGLETALSEPVRVFEELATTKLFSAAADFTTDDLCLLEGALSRIWQAWCGFCREVLVESCMGTVDLSGNVIAAVPGAISDLHVSAAAIRAKNSRPIDWGRTNSLLRLEPTWGDVDLLLDIIAWIAPSNSATLNGMCTLAGSGARFLQIARNASAHDNFQTRAELVGVGSAYSTFPITHACQALFWVEASSQKYLLPFSIEQLIDASVFLTV